MFSGKGGSSLHHKSQKRGGRDCPHQTQFAKTVFYSQSKSSSLEFVQPVRCTYSTSFTFIVYLMKHKKIIVLGVNHFMILNSPVGEIVFKDKIECASYPDCVKDRNVTKMDMVLFILFGISHRESCSFFTLGFQVKSQALKHNFKYNKAQLSDSCSGLLFNLFEKGKKTSKEKKFCFLFL